ncbi:MULTISPECIES: TetR/AcrR family transcriptional regulator [Streptomyces]|uniref:TetR-family transcriptional regulator n=1 Tax=Streptomyces griseus subsp. griseus (strain JCM 4626 / CBS 651.72 / NBRC 13350 / KCC S-0626 / ISP 5235) TaxID=455632 RepID=B1VLH4_STRGG|nr:TetR/AcrR family transcriptional regulator [Streptomyces griseus]BAG23365.1 putative TetR-family transcriptional regulator [Streptomyces griseus subsp. griseus NBRC 13350]SEE35826.1 regulatory protein, tetR family [Streptomyces griseus]SQA20587.1 TetR family transcriptional regulator [Streptomyces griseus]
MSTIRGARERARIEVTAAIKDEARKQLAAEGAAKLSLRAVARELGMVSSALYRYFPSRDDLLTALIVDAFDAIGAVAERAAKEWEGKEREGKAPHAERWIAVACAVREWGLAHPHEYALIYGSPVPGYIAPMDTVGPASRVGLVFIDIVRTASRAEELAVPPLAPELRSDAERMTAEFAEGVPPAAVAALVAAWAQLFGLISFELFGQFNRVVEAREPLFRQAAGELARSVGLRAVEVEPHQR